MFLAEVGVMGTPLEDGKYASCVKAELGVESGGMGEKGWVVQAELVVIVPVVVVDAAAIVVEDGMGVVAQDLLGGGTDGKSSGSVETADPAAESVGAMSLSGLTDEKRFEPLLDEPLGGGDQVRLIFSNGIEHVLSWSDEEDENDEAEQQLASSAK